MNNLENTPGLPAIPAIVMYEESVGPPPTDPSTACRLLEAAKKGLQFDRVVSFVAATALAGTMVPASTVEASIQQTPSKPQPTRVHTLKPVFKPKCTPRNQVQFSLKGPRAVTSGHSAKFKITAKRCQNASPEILKKVKLVEQHSGQRKKKVWKAEKYAAGKKRNKNLKLVFAESKPGEKIKAPDNTRKVTLKAYNAKGKQIGSNQWKLKYIPSDCKPDPNFAIGVQDDDQFIWQRDVAREQALQIASSAYGSKILRINIIHGKVMETGYQPYIDTVDAAIAQGYKVQATIMQTPSYMENLDQSLNYENLDPAVTRSFARQVASVLGNKVMLYSIGNEPNHHFFSMEQTYQKYAPMYRAGQEGVLAANPKARVIAGELAPGDSLNSWMKNFRQLKSDGIALHPYGDTIDRLPELVKEAAEKPVYLSEYGNEAYKPNQAANNKRAIRLARCSGATQLIFYQLFDKPSPTSGWNTGAVDIGAYK